MECLRHDGAYLKEYAGAVIVSYGVACIWFKYHGGRFCKPHAKKYSILSRSDSVGEESLQVYIEADYRTSRDSSLVKFAARI